MISGATALAVAMGSAPAHAATTLERPGNFRATVDKVDARQVKITFKNLGGSAITVAEVRFHMEVPAGSPGKYATKSTGKIAPGQMFTDTSGLPPGTYKEVSAYAGSQDTTVRKPFSMTVTQSTPINPAPAPKPDPKPEPKGPFGIDFGSLKFW
ncbi:hypothetical protein [Gordonia crocea]|nr:hypothetical protein [Gordonia crocea]